MYRVLAPFRFLIFSFSLSVIVISGMMIFASSQLGFADDFDHLMGKAVERGTQIDAARSRKSAAEASVRRAWTKFLPSIRGYGDFAANRNNALGRFKGLNRNSYDSSQYGVSATLPIYRGGENYYGLKEARANAKAERHNFEETKQSLLLDTARAILGIIRDREVVSLQRKNREIVKQIVRSTEQRYQGGEATKTDIELAQDQYTSAQSVYTQSLDNLHQSEVDFKRLIGRAPGPLYLPKAIHNRLPKNLREAVALAEEQNPQLLAALMRSKAAEHAVSGSYSQFLPSVDLKMDYTEDRYHGIESNDESDFSVKLNFSVPLFQPEAFPANQESRHVSNQRKYEARDARYTAKAMAKIAWNSYHTAKKRYGLALSRIKASRAAARGMRRELQAGQRTVLDVLDTQERLVQAMVQAENAQFERYMAAHLLLSAVGRLDVQSAGNDEYITYTHAAKKLRQRRERSQNKWRLRDAQLQKKTSPALIKKGVRASKIAAAQPLDLPWYTRVSYNGSAYVKRSLTRKLALPIMKSRLLKSDGLAVKPLVKPAYVLPPKGEAPKQNIRIKPEQKVIDKRFLRNGIYSKFQDFQADKIITGSVSSFPKKQSVRLAKKFKAFAVHKIPVPLKKKWDDEEIITGSINKTTHGSGTLVEEYPDTFQNRFAVWWNKGVDKLIGPAGKPQPVLIPLDEYHKRRKMAE